MGHPPINGVTLGTRKYLELRRRQGEAIVNALILIAAERLQELGCLDDSTPSATTFNLNLHNARTACLTSHKGLPIGLANGVNDK